MGKSKLPTMWDVAKLAGVTQATVSHVINGTAPISEKVRTRVINAIEELGYVPNAVARSLKQNKTNTLGLLIPDVHSGYYSEMTKAVEENARKKGYITFLCNTSYDQQLEELYINNLLQQHVAGIILGYGLLNEKALFKIRNSRTPVLIIDGSGKFGKYHIPSVEVDNLKGSKLVVEYLHSIGITQDIGFISEPLQHSALQRRFEGFKRSLESFNCPINYDFFSIEDKQYDKIQMGYKAVERILKKGRPRAIFVTSDQVALGVIKRLKELNIKIPEEVAVIGYDDVPLATVITPRLTTISQPIYSMAQQGVKMILEIIEGKTIENDRIILQPTLVVRESA